MGVLEKRLGELSPKGRKPIAGGIATGTDSRNNVPTL
jgi:hypothetical protein